MKWYVLRRILLMVPTFIGITFITYGIVRMAPGDYATMQMGFQGTMQSEALQQEYLEQEKKLFGLDKPVPVGYALWLGKFITGDFGISRKDKRPVSERIADTLPVTLLLNVISIFLVYLLSVPLGVTAAVKKGSLWDRGSSLVLFILYSLPAFWVGLLLLKYFSGGEYLNLFPLGGVISPWAESFPFLWKVVNVAWHLVLPVATLTYTGLAFLSRYARANMLEVLHAQYITTARAKGIGERRVIFIHAFRNTLVPLVTLMASLLPSLLGGSVIVESIFSIPGMGLLAFEAILSRDLPVIMAITSLSAILTLLGILLADIAYALVDPRIRLEAAT